MDVLILKQARDVLNNAISLAVKNFLLTTTSDVRLHADLLAMGIFAFKPRFIAVLKDQLRSLDVRLGTLAAADTLAKEVYLILERSWDKHYPATTPKQFLDAYEAPPDISQDEIDRSWEVEIASDEQYMRDQWDGSARVRKGRLDALGLKSGRGSPYDVKGRRRDG